MNIAVLCCEDRKSDDIKAIIKINEDWCQRHGYEFILDDNYLPNNVINPYWRKILFVRQVLRTSKYNYVMWIDSDAVVNLPDIKIESLICDSDKCLFFCSDPPFWEAEFNTGVFIVKNCDKSRKLFDQWLSMYDSTKWKWNKKTATWECKGQWAGMDYEQGTGGKLVTSKKWRSYCKIFPWYLFQGVYNRTPYYDRLSDENKNNQSKQFIIHFSASKSKMWIGHYLRHRTSQE